jgi:hypothetical protein
MKVMVTDLQLRHLLEAKLHEAIRLAREKIGIREVSVLLEEVE